MAHGCLLISAAVHVEKLQASQKPRGDECVLITRFLDNNPGILRKMYMRSPYQNIHGRAFRRSPDIVKTVQGHEIPPLVIPVWNR